MGFFKEGWTYQNQYSMYKINLLEKRKLKIKWASQSLFTTIQKREIESKANSIFIQWDKLVKVIILSQKLLN